MQWLQAAMVRRGRALNHADSRLQVLLDRTPAGSLENAQARLHWQEGKP